MIIWFILYLFFNILLQQVKLHVLTFFIFILFIEMYLWYLYKTAVKIETNDEAYAHMYIYIHFFEKKSYSYILLYHIAFQRLMTNNTTKALIVIRQIFIVSLLQNLKWNKNGTGKKMLTIINHFVSCVATQLVGQERR